MQTRKYYVNGCNYFQCTVCIQCCTSMRFIFISNDSFILLISQDSIIYDYVCFSSLNSVNISNELFCCMELNRYIITLSNFQNYQSVFVLIITFYFPLNPISHSILHQKYICISFRLKNLYYSSPSNIYFLKRPLKSSLPCKCLLNKY